MARVLILRDGAAAVETARELERRGHAPLFLPLQEIRETLEPPPPPPPGGAAFAAAVVSSRNAVPALVRHRTAMPAKILAVGAATAAALRAAGFADVAAGANAAESLVAPATALARHAELPLLLALGRPRRPVLEEGLAAADAGFVVWETYDARPLRPGRDIIAAALGNRAPDAVLVLSGGQAQGLGAAARAAPDLLPPILRVLCLSERIASLLPVEFQTSALISPSREPTPLFECIAETSFDSKFRR